MQSEDDGVVCQVPEKGACWSSHAQSSGKKAPKGEGASDHTSDRAANDGGKESSSYPFGKVPGFHDGAYPVVREAFKCLTLIGEEDRMPQLGPATC
eukprot:14215568-Heterocapsa_arctica.AAC.1